MTFPKILILFLASAFRAQAWFNFQQAYNPCKFQIGKIQGFSSISRIFLIKNAGFEAKGLVEIEKGKILEALPKMGISYQVSVDVILKKLPSSRKWLNILQICDQSRDKGYGARNPAIWYHYDPNRYGKISFFRIETAFDNNWAKNFEYHVVPNKTYNLQITQFLEETNIQTEVKVNGYQVFKGQNTRARQFPHPKAYFSSPWADAFTSEFGTVKNVKIYTEPKCWAGQKSVPSITAAPKCKVKKIHS